MPKKTNHITIGRAAYAWLPGALRILNPEEWIVVCASFAALVATYYSFAHQYIIAYGDAESHLNIAKRVVDSLTPGFAQLGGIWLPLPHLLLMPFVYSNFFWHTGLAGSVVSGVAFVVSAVYIYKLGHLLSRNKAAATFGTAVFVLNPNILYMQTTPMSELPLIVFSLLSTYYFIRFLMDDTKLIMLIAAAGFGFCASLSRYDGWGLVAMEAGILVLYYFPWKIDFTALFQKGKSFIVTSTREQVLKRYHTMEGRTIMFCTLAFFGVVIWLMWCFLILGDPLYFTHSQFSANSQQQSWLSRGQLPAYHHVFIAFLYYFMTTVDISGIVVSMMALLGLALFLFDPSKRFRFYTMLVLLVPFFFNTLTLYLGQSVIFLPGLTPTSYGWTIFNVRYGVLMVPTIAVLLAYLFSKAGSFGRFMAIVLLAAQCSLFLIGYSPVLALDDGLKGLSSATAQMPDAQIWFENNYDYGMLLADDFARTISVVRTKVPMNQVIYIGNKPYWEDSLVAPETYARWIVMQKNDTLWKRINEDPETNARLYTYFNKVYTSDTILIFRRISN